MGLHTDPSSCEQQSKCVCVCLSVWPCRKRPPFTRNHTPNHALHQPPFTPNHGLRQPPFAPATVYTNHGIYQTNWLFVAAAAFSTGLLRLLLLLLCCCLLFGGCCCRCCSFFCCCCCCFWSCCFPAQRAQVSMRAASTAKRCEI